ncbi:hypothetical protein [Roseospira navarrensis]|uniref:Uncharacterized protein n=1 Tax=Roseospira navarrensis TaxID=140058 RepID=A0A7X2D320_9PROT|nr:hypothetical protein [Roseospira navarrensis]MQX36849.1 hypothetical protein [Roseospira navarrensis]
MSAAPQISPALGHPPCESRVVVARPGGARVEGVLKTVRRVAGGRAVWSVRVPVDGHPHPEGELVHLTVEIGADGIARAVAGETLRYAVHLAETITAGREVREPVNGQLMALSSALLALHQDQGGPVS